MKQTLLALLGLLIVTFFSFSQQQASVQSQRQAVQAELEQMALGIGMQTMEVIRARAFDQNVSARAGEYTSPEKFTRLKDFGVSGNCRLHPYGDMQNPYGQGTYEGGQNCNFIESFDGTNTTVPHLLPGNKTYPFNVDVEVWYVCDDMNIAKRKSGSCPAPSGRNCGSCSAPTDQKEVVLRIQDDPPEGQDPRLPRIRYTEVIAYP